MLEEQSSTSLPATERKEEKRISKEISKILSIQKQNSNTFNPRSENSKLRLCAILSLEKSSLQKKLSLEGDSRNVWYKDIGHATGTTSDKGGKRVQALSNLA